MKNMTRKIIFILFAVCLCGNAFSQEEITDAELDSMCRVYDPCLCLVDSTRASEIFDYYRQIRKNYKARVGKIVRTMGDSLKFKVANWGDSLFEADVWHYDCLGDLFYAIYLWEDRMSRKLVMENLKDTVKINMIYNDERVDLRAKDFRIFMFYTDFTDALVRISEQPTFDNRFIVPECPKGLTNSAILKYKGKFYNIGYQYGGDVIWVNIETSRENNKTDGSVSVRHYNEANEGHFFSDLKTYSSSNKRILKKKTQDSAAPQKRTTYVRLADSLPVLKYLSTRDTVVIYGKDVVHVDTFDIGGMRYHVTPEVATKLNNLTDGKGTLFLYQKNRWKPLIKHYICFQTLPDGYYYLAFMDNSFVDQKNCISIGVNILSKVERRRRR